MRMSLKMTATLLLAVVLCLHTSHAFVPSRLSATTATNNGGKVLFEAPKKDGSENASPSAASSFVMTSKNSTVAASQDLPKDPTSTKDKVSNTTNAVLTESDSIGPPSPNKAKKPTPLDKAYKALEEEQKSSAAANNSETTASVAGVKKDVQEKPPVTSGDAKEGRKMTPKPPAVPPPASKLSSIYNRKEVPPLEQLPSNEKKSSAVVAKTASAKESKVQVAANDKLGAPKTKDDAVTKSLDKEASSAITKDESKASKVSNLETKVTPPSGSTEVKKDGSGDKKEPVETSAKATFVAAPDGNVKDKTGANDESAKDTSKPMATNVVNDTPKVDLKASHQKDEAVSRPSDDKKKEPAEPSTKAAFIAAPNGQVKDKTGIDESKDKAKTVVASPSTKVEVKDSKQDDSKATPLKESVPEPKTVAAGPVNTPKNKADAAFASPKNVKVPTSSESGVKDATKGSAATSVKDTEKAETKSAPLKEKSVPVAVPVAAKHVKVSSSSPDSETKGLTKGSTSTVVKDAKANDPKSAPMKDEAVPVAGSVAETKDETVKASTDAKINVPPAAAAKNVKVSASSPESDVKATTRESATKATKEDKASPVDDVKSSVSSPSPKVDVKTAVQDVQKPSSLETSVKKETVGTTSSSTNSKADTRERVSEKSPTAISIEDGQPVAVLEVEMKEDPAEATSNTLASPAKQEKSGFDALSDFFFGSNKKTASEEDDSAVMQRIKERAQEKVDDSSEETSLSKELQATKDALEQLKQESQNTIAEIRAEAEQSEAQWREQVNEMAVKVDVAESFQKQAKARMQQMMEDHVELDSEVKEWKELYARDSPLWTEKYEREREYRRREQIEARKRLSQYMKDSRDKLALANEEGRKREEMIREELTRVLEQNKRTLSYTTIELKQAKAALIAQDEKIEELGDDRDSLRQLAGEALGLIKERTKKRWNMLKSRLWRNRKTQSKE